MDLLFKNITSVNKRRKIVASVETSENQGVRSVIHRHFVWIIKEIKESTSLARPMPYLYILKEHNSREQRAKFFCKLKGSMYLAHKGRQFLVIFMHTLKIDLVAGVQSFVKDDKKHG